MSAHSHFAAYSPFKRSVELSDTESTAGGDETEPNFDCQSFPQLMRTSESLVLPSAKRFKSAVNLQEQRAHRDARAGIRRYQGRLIRTYPKPESDESALAEIGRLHVSSCWAPNGPATRVSVTTSQNYARAHVSTTEKTSVQPWQPQQYQRYQQYQHMAYTNAYPDSSRFFPRSQVPSVPEEPEPNWTHMARLSESKKRPTNSGRWKEYLKKPNLMVGDMVEYSRQACYYATGGAYGSPRGYPGSEYEPNTPNMV